MTASAHSIRKHHVQADIRTIAVVSIVIAGLSEHGGQGPESGSRRLERPTVAGRFPSPGHPARAERIRFFDVKHIKAALAIDTKKREVRGTVTHTLSPLHPYLTQVELDCGPALKGQQGDRRHSGGALRLHRKRRQAVGHP